MDHVKCTSSGRYRAVTLLKGKVALVTGTAKKRGQGAAEAALFVREGARVIITDVLDDEGNALVQSIGNQATYEHLDVTSEMQWQRVIRLIQREHGQIDILVNNAGVWSGTGVIDTSPQEYRRIVEVNQTGVYLGMHFVAPLMKARRSGSIINISSTAGLRVGLPYWRRLQLTAHAYVASKWAVRGMTKAAAKELAACNVRVNSIHPGVIDTPMLAGEQDELAEDCPMGRLGTPEEVAEMVLFLASGKSTYISGAEIAIDGASTT